MTEDLFGAMDAPEDMTRPLAVRMRPSSVDEVVGQSRVLGQGSPLRRLANPASKGSLTAPSSIILFGPPGVGKTTLAYIVAKQSGRVFEELSAVTSGVKDVRDVLRRAHDRLVAEGKETVLFIDEVHRFSKSQQDALLPSVENRDVTFIAATTENPSFSIIKPLLSRSVVVKLESLEPDDLKTLIKRAIESERGLKNEVKINDEAVDEIVRMAGGDARKTLTILEAAAGALTGDQARKKGTKRPIITPDVVSQVMDVATVRYDKDGDDHYDVISAFIKSMRGSDPDAPCTTWHGCCAPARIRDSCTAHYDRSFRGSRYGGSADTAGHRRGGTSRVHDRHARGAHHSRGSRARRCHRSEVERQLQRHQQRARRCGRGIDRSGTLAPKECADRLMKSWGNHEGYRYAHDWPGAVAPQQYMPDELAGREYYHPNDRGYEHEIKPRLEKIRKILHEKNGDRADRFFPPLTSSPISVYNADLVNVNIRSCSTWRASLGKLGRSVEGNDEAMRNMQDESNQRLIMIVDDDQALGEMLSIVLESEGFKTVTCLDGWRAVEMFPTLQPDLMLLDVMLPGLDGVQVAQRIRQNSNTPIIMLTAKSDTTDVVKGLEAGADDYVSKPFEVVELMARIRLGCACPR